jgi:chromosome segregation ATPase
MSTPEANQAPQQFQDPTPVIRALQAQRNSALDQLADVSANLTVAQSHLQGMSEEFAKTQSQLDDTNTQLEQTKAALADMQARNASLDKANVELMQELNQFRPAAQPA